MAIIDITPNVTGDATDVTLTNVVWNAVLDGLNFGLQIQTNKFNNAWQLNLLDSNGNPLVYGLGLEAGMDLLFPYRYKDEVPAGKLFVASFNGQTDPTLNSFIDGTHGIFYQEAEE